MNCLASSALLPLHSTDRSTDRLTATCARPVPQLIDPLDYLSKFDRMHIYSAVYPIYTSYLSSSWSSWSAITSIGTV